MKKKDFPEQIQEQIENNDAENRSMKRQKVLLYAACGLLLLQIAVYALLLIRDGKASEVTRELLIRQTADEISGITFRAADRTVLSFSEENGQWVLDAEQCDFSDALPDALPDGKDPSEWAISQEAVRILVSGVTGIAVRQKIGDPEDLAEYGLDAPFTEAQVRMKDGSSVHLMISDTAENSRSVYVIKDRDASKVYVCVPALKNSFEKSLKDFIES